MVKNSGTTGRHAEQPESCARGPGASNSDGHSQRYGLKRFAARGERASTVAEQDDGYSRSDGKRTDYNITITIPPLLKLGGGAADHSMCERCCGRPCQWKR